MFVINVLTSVSSSFSECFSAKSYLSGNSISYELTLNLLPFERLNLITEQNLCQMYLPGKTVVVQLHFDDISFPTAGQEIIFEYKFNEPIDVTFKLSKDEYKQIYPKENAMYELWYDVNLVKVNSSVNTITHTKYNGTNCYKDIDLTYTIYENIQINVNSSNCDVKLDLFTQVYIEYQVNNTIEQIPILPCINDCDPAEYMITSTNYKKIKMFNVLSTVNSKDHMSNFFTNFINNRRIPIYFVIKYQINGVFAIITQKIYNYYSVDTLRCTIDDSIFSLAGTLNPHNLHMQYRYTSLNQLNCDTQGVTKVKIDIYIFDQITSYRGNQVLPLNEFNNNIGATFEINNELTTLRNNFSEEETTSIIVVSYLDEDGQIIWESIQVDRAYIGCISKATMHLYRNQTCIRYQFDNNLICSNYYLNATDLNSIGIFYEECGVSHSLGYYIFYQAINYSISDQTMCFICDDFVDNDTYAKKTCEENQRFTKEKLKTATVGFGIISNYESILLKTVVSEYYGVFMPLIVVCSISFVVVLIIVLSFIQLVNK
ncbi:Conserved_hypothetical protein [Hexamita inflata]|uniref:Transmembrane protein n=1 Tax=Hexamita inflata TaxID=28002 RepID=A0AA86QPY5_9EUKA|nr:Conserved hypothetical protein [Hexamita inflata]